MGEKRRKYSREFKIEAVRRVTEGHETVAEIARALGIEPNNLYGWVKQLKSEAGEAFRGNGKLTAQDEEIRRLRHENAELRGERDFLKKTATMMFENAGEETPAQYFCPICGLQISRPAYVNGQGSFDICPCCDFEYGWRDGLGQETFESWRRKWVLAGANWDSDGAGKPTEWDAAAQLRNIGIDLQELREGLSLDSN